MKGKKEFEVIITGGSYAGLSAAMGLGRALRKVLVIDSGKPCNRYTPHSHNFLTQDGKTPGDILKTARVQVETYPTVAFYQGLVTEGKKTKKGFEIKTEDGNLFEAKKLIFASGIKDLFPDIEGFEACWGKSVIHCPYCHGYEVRHKKTAILANGDNGFHYAGLIAQWTRDLTVLTNGKSTLTEEQGRKIRNRNISVIETEVRAFEHNNGHLKNVIFKDGNKMASEALYTRPPFEQHCPVPEKLGCELTNHGLIQVDPLQKTSVDGVYACGDNSSNMRSVAHAVSSGTMAAGGVNHAFVEKSFSTV